MKEIEVNKNVNYPRLEDVLTLLWEARAYFAKYKNSSEIKPHEVDEVRVMLKLEEKAEAIIYQEIDLMRSSVLSKKDLAKATGISRATFFRSLKRRNFSLGDLTTICMLLIDPTLKDEFTFIADMEKFIKSKPKDRQDILWVFFYSLFVERENSPFHNIDLKNADEVLAACKILQTRVEIALDALRVKIGSKETAPTNLSTALSSLRQGLV